jgi:hypothetical protein
MKIFDSTVAGGVGPRKNKKNRKTHVPRTPHLAAGAGPRKKKRKKQKKIRAPVGS